MRYFGGFGLPEAVAGHSDAVVIDRGDFSSVAAVEITDASLLFSADYSRVGADLHLTGADGSRVVIIDYFAFPPADLVSPDGAVVRAHTVAALAGPNQEGVPDDLILAAVPGSPIGLVERLEGTASVQRTDGSVEDLTMGDRVFLGDVVMTGEGSVISLTFVDGTVFMLNENARMTLDELVYTAGAEDGNSASFGLVQGSFVFIAGQVAKTGGMDIETPAATLGIRGTTGLVDVVTRNGVLTVEVTLETDPGSDETGRITLRAPDGDEFAVLTQTETSWLVTIDGQRREISRTTESRLEDAELLAEASAAYFAAEARADADEPYVPIDTSGSSGNFNSDDADQRNFETGAGGTLGDLPTGSGDGTEGAESRQFKSLGLQSSGTTLANAQNADFALKEDGRLTGVLPVSLDTGTTPDIRLIEGPANGVLALSRDGAFSYFPDTDFSGSDSFVYSVTDSTGTKTARVNIFVEPVNDAPTTENSTSFVTEDGAATGAAVATDIDGDVLTLAVLEGPANGSLAFGTDGRWAYTPDTDFAGEDRFTWTASDGTLSDTGVVRIVVTQVEDAPEITGAATGSVAENGIPEARGQLLAFDPDPDDAPSFIAQNNVAGLFGTFSLTATGEWIYRLDAAMAETLAGDQTVVERFAVEAITRDGERAQVTVAVEISGSADAPVVGDVALVTAGAPVDGAIDVNDVDSGDVAIFSLVGAGPANGSVQFNDDGTFTYTPDDGFTGFDPFAIAVTDREGLRSEAQVGIAVGGSTFEPENGQDLSISIESDGTEDAAAGAVRILTSAVETPTIVVTLVLDRSGSIRVEGWIDLKADMVSAVERIFDRFEGSDSEVLVNVVTYATDATILSDADGKSTFNLLEERDELIALIDRAGYSRGLTNFGEAFAAAEQTLDASGAETSQAAYVYFVTDGVPTDADEWQQSFADLINAPFDGLTPAPGPQYDVTFEAFGIGSTPDIDLLNELDSNDATIVSGPDALALAFDETPFFSAELVSFSLRLIADGVDEGIVADQNSDAFSASGLNYTLTLAEVEGIGDLLAAQNLFLAEANFDLDGDSTTIEATIRTADLLTTGETAVISTGTDRADLIFGSAQDDTISSGGDADIVVGGTGNDSLSGEGGGDLLIGGTGIDTLSGGEGDDRLVAGAEPQSGEIYNGGAGRDILELLISDDADGDLLGSLDLSGLEAISLENGAADRLGLSLDDVLEAAEGLDPVLEALIGPTTTGKSMMVYGEAGDEVTLDKGAAASIDLVQSVNDPASGSAFDVYEFSSSDGEILATLAIDQDVAIAGAPTG